MSPGFLGSGVGHLWHKLCLVSSQHRAERAFYLVDEITKMTSMSLPAGLMRKYRRSIHTHVIVCPFCETGHSVPTDFDSIHRCTCGACYKVCGQQALENGVGDIAEELWSEEELSFVRTIPVDFCNIIIEKDFDRLLDLKHSSDLLGIERFCKYDLNNNLSLVWVKRLF